MFSISCISSRVVRSVGTLALVVAALTVQATPAAAGLENADKLAVADIRVECKPNPGECCSALTQRAEYSFNPNTSNNQDRWVRYAGGGAWQ